MTDNVQASVSDAPEVVQTEAEQVEAPEAVESTEGQVETQPAEGEAPEGDQSEDEGKVSASKARRERHRAALAKAKAEAEQARQEAERLQAEVDRLKSRKQAPPKREDFKDYDDYLAAKTAHQALDMMGKDRLEDAEREATARQKAAQEAQTRQFEEAKQNWAAQTEEARLRYADFDAVVSAPDLPISQSMTLHIAMSDIGADIAYHLGMNKEQAREIARMSPQEQAGAMRMLERFVSAQKPRPRTQTKAPDPITPVKPKATAGKRPEDMTPEEFDKWRASGGTFKL